MKVLHDDLIIASAERRREPELPAATVAAALAAPPPSEGGTARYDLVLFPTTEADPVTAGIDLLAEEFAEDGHRVLRLEAAEVGLEALARRRRVDAIEAAALLVPDPRWGDAAKAAGARWGWPVVAAARTGEGADVVVRPEAGRAAVDRAVRAAFPRASIAVLTFDNLAFTRLCLESVLANTEYPNYELLVVDNASTDGTPAYLRALAGAFPQVRPIFNDANRGFGPGNNQAMAEADGEVLVFLNNDTIVPRGWLTRLARHLSESAVGLIGPATNRTCNEAQVAAPYETYGDLLRFAAARAAAHDGERRPIRMPMMFCAATRRDVWEAVGALDERFEVGMFEDEDFALRVQAAGFETAWAPDAYVHHAYHASIGKLLPTGEYAAVFKANQRRFEEKWGICWERHRPPK